MSDAGRAERLPPLGATVRDGAVEFRAWAPVARRVQLQLEDPEATLELAREPGDHGLWSLRTGAARPGSRYRYRIDGGEPLPDPCSRFQPLGVHGPSQVVDPAFAWQDAGWPGLRREGLVVYELHVGTFTPAGTFDGVAGRLPYLRELGVTAIELMPVADFPGGRNWGYDGVALYAPSRAYGEPASLRRLVDAAHRLGLGVVLDVVYNHLGPEGNYLRAFGPFYFTDRYQTPWGEAINYDGEGARLVREFVFQNVEHWLREYHIDGLRLDATHAIRDSSEPHLLAELADRARAATPRGVVLIAENDANDVRLVRPRSRGGYGLDAVWADDFHHAVHVTLTGEREGYYADYHGGAEEIPRTLRGGFLYQGQTSPRRGKPRGTAVTDEPGGAFVFCLENHDQVGNRALGERLNQLVLPSLFRAATALLLLAPETPLLFMGQEFNAATPFQFFTDFNDELGRLVTEGRRNEFRGFSAFQDPALRDQIPDPQAEETFLRSRLDWGEVERNAGMLRLYRELLRLRRDDAVLRAASRLETEATALGERALAVLRRSGAQQRLLLVNLGRAALPLDAGAVPGLEACSRVLVSTADPAYLAPGEAPTQNATDLVALRTALPPATAVLLA
jgi:maltooligosyltrehalose trehalohydrolase